MMTTLPFFILSVLYVIEREMHCLAGNASWVVQQAPLGSLVHPDLKYTAKFLMVP
jgi:hypothetical protein